MLAALRWARTQGYDHIITAPCDAPFLPPDLAARLEAISSPLVLARSHGTQHPTIGKWSLDLAESLGRAHEQQGQRRMHEFVATIIPQVIDWPHEPYDPFFNVNTPFDLAIAEAIVNSKATPAVLDLEGLKCPLPALKTAKALDSLPLGACIEVSATDPLAMIDIPHLVHQRGDVLLASQSGKVLHFLIGKK